MARAALRMTAKEVSEASGVSLATIQRMETVDGEPSSTKANLSAIQRALESAGVRFIGETGVELIPAAAEQQREKAS